MKYETINAQWPPVMPTLTGPEAISAAKRLYRIAMGKPLKLKVKLTSGRRYTWPRSGVLYVNPEGHHFGPWQDLVHDISHWCHRRLHPKAPAHGAGHAWLEGELVAEVVRRGWLNGTLRQEAKPKPDLREVRHQRLLVRLDNWERKHRRAEKAIKDLRRKIAYYERIREKTNDPS